METANKIIIKIIVCITMSAAFLNVGCKKLVNVDPPETSVDSKIVFSSDNDAIAVMTNLYIRLGQSNVTVPADLPSLSLFSGLSSDELIPFGSVNPVQIAHYNCALSNNIPGITDYWTNAYNMIFVTNAAIEELSGATMLSEDVKRGILGEAKFMRAFLYFYLVNIYGDVPLNLTTDYKANSVRPRTSVAEIYNQIVVDLKDARSLLSRDYKTAQWTVSQERTRPNSYAASALLARVFLYKKDYVNAEIEATSVIEQSDLFELPFSSENFLKESKEIIWALQSVDPTITNTSEAILFVPDLSIGGYTPTVYLQDRVVKLFSDVDKRKLNWIDSVEVAGKFYPYPKKYKNNQYFSMTSEYRIVFRLAEQYLIRAEARAFLNKLTGSNSAESDLNVIRQRAGIDLISTSNNRDEVLDAIMDERERELFTEWGHRWFDLKRTNRANEVLGLLKGNNWQSTDQLYPIPQAEIDGNPAIKGHQNPGY